MSANQAFARLLEAAAGLPEVEEGTWYGALSLKVRNKGLCRIKDAETVVMRCPLEEKEILLESAPEIYFETDHYKGWPAILVRIGAIKDEELRHRLQVAWRMQAPKSVLRALEGRE